VSGLAPATDGDLNEGMSALNRFILGPAKRSRFITYPFLAMQDFVTHRWPERALQMALGQFPEPDRALLSQPHVKAAFIEDSRLSSATTAMACAQDFTLFARDWGFGLGDIAVPVDVWHGDVDRNVPFSHGKHQAERIPKALFHECPGEGHMLFITHFEEILRSVVSH
jgi:pimeloyl-ACP methyl ester carboxylesterase